MKKLKDNIKVIRVLIALVIIIICIIGCHNYLNEEICPVNYIRQGDICYQRDEFEVRKDYYCDNGLKLNLTQCEKEITMYEYYFGTKDHETEKQTEAYLTFKNKCDKENLKFHEEDNKMVCRSDFYFEPAKVRYLCEEIPPACADIPQTKPVKRYKVMIHNSNK